MMLAIVIASAIGWGLLFLCAAVFCFLVYAEGRNEKHEAAQVYSRKHNVPIDYALYLIDHNQV